jgi:hypothetical protein
MTQLVMVLLLVPAVFGACGGAVGSSPRRKKKIRSPVDACVPVMCNDPSCENFGFVNILAATSFLYEMNHVARRL